MRTDTLVELPFYTEGPVVDKIGNYYFTTLAGGQVYRVDPAGTASVWAVLDCPNGQAIDHQGNHLICESRRGAICLIDEEGNFVKDVVAGKCADTAIGTPNDVIVTADGGIYFTDSTRHRGNVFYISPQGREYLVATGLDYPNGLVLSADNKRLFVAESYANRIVCIRLRAPDRSDGMEVFAELPRHKTGLPEKNLPDGLAIDRHGRLWVAHYGMGALQVINARGEWLCSVPTGLPLTSNVCFLPGSNRGLLVSGGFGEPGPGALKKLTLSNL